MSQVTQVTAQFENFEILWIFHVSKKINALVRTLNDQLAVGSNPAQLGRNNLLRYVRGTFISVLGILGGIKPCFSRTLLPVKFPEIFFSLHR